MNLTPIPTFDDVTQLETITLALAGPGGIMNAQAQALLNRTQFLRDALTAVESQLTGFVTDAEIGNTLDASMGAGLPGYDARRTYSTRTVGRELRRWLSLDHFVSDVTGSTDVAAGFAAAIAVANSVGAVGLYGSPTSTYMIRSKVDLSTARNLVLDFRGATLIDDVRTVRGDMGGRGDHAFLLYGNSGVEVCNLNYQAAPTRLVHSVEIPSIAFWIGGQSEGNALTRWARVRNVVATTPIVGMMFASVVGEAAGVEVDNIELTGRWSYGTNLEYGDVPVDPSTNNTITNGKHPYNALIRNMRGYDLLDCLGFLRTASCYSVKFENCQGSNVRSFIYGYVGDRNISRFSQSVTFENCKSKVVSSAALSAANYDVQIISVNEDGSTGIPLPSWTNYRHMFRFVNCEFQSGSRTDNTSVRFYGNKGKVVFEQCIFRDTYYGLVTGPSTNPSYVSVGVLTFRDCLFVNNYQDIVLQNCDGVTFDNCRMESQNPASTLVVASLQNAKDTQFTRCRFSVKGSSGPNHYISITGCTGTVIEKNNFAMLSTAHFAISSTDSTMKGYGNETNGLLTANTLTAMGIVGENRTMMRDLASVSGGVITFEKGANYENSTTETIGRVIGGAVGDIIQFRGVGGASSVTFQHVFGGVPTLERLINKSLANDTVTGAVWSRYYMKFNDGWRQM